MKFMNASWANIIMANYPVDPELLEPYLPYGTALDQFNGQTFVSLVGFMFMRSRIFGFPVPCFGNFEEVNLRFYATRKEKGSVKRGVVFINETVPYGAVAWAARRLYKERYTKLPVSHHWTIGESEKEITYSWDVSDTKNSLFVRAQAGQRNIEPGSIEEFILEHYYGYTRISGNRTSEFRIAHPRWKVHPVTEFDVKVDFAAMYGPSFSQLTAAMPQQVLLTEGSEVTIEWGRRIISSRKSIVSDI